MVDWKELLATRLKSARGSEAQESLSTRSGVSARAISFIETRKLIRPPRTGTLIKLAVATNTDPTDWLRDAGLPPPSPEEVQRIRRGAASVIRAVGASGPFRELLDREKQLDARREVWVVQGDQFSDVRAREVWEAVLGNVARKMQYRFFYPYWDGISGSEWCSTHEDDLDGLRQGAADGSKIAGYRVDARDFPLFSIDALRVLFYTPGGLPLQQECYRVVCLRGPDEIDEALYFEEHPAAKGRILQFLDGVVRKQDHSEQPGRLRQPRPPARRETAKSV